MGGDQSTTLQRYQLATLLYGLHDSPIEIISSSEGLPGSLYDIFNPLLSPASFTDKTSGLPSANIRNISAVHLPIPGKIVSLEIISSSSKFTKEERSNSPFLTDEANLRMYPIFALDNPDVLNWLKDIFEIFSGVNLSVPIKSKSLPFIALAA